MTNESKIQQAANLIRSAAHLVALTGAGVSTPSGIPDFRSPGLGLWERDDPMSVASIWGFVEHPQGFFEWLRPLTQLMFAAQPNPAHCALADLEAMGRLNVIVTQNIDNLHQLAGSKRVLEVHGHMREATCIRCYHIEPGRPLLSKFLEDGEIPTCSVCGGVMKPNVVLLGEMLPVSVMYEAEQESQACDVMLIAGSSLQVAPAGDLPLIAKRKGAQLIIINKTPTPVDAQAVIVLHEDVAVALPKIAALVRPA